MKPFFTTKHISSLNMPRRNIDKIKRIIVHSSATNPRMDIGRDEINGWHKARGFVAVGYHFVIRRDGSIEKARDIACVGAHAKGNNYDSIGICMVGGVSEVEGESENNFTDAQFKSLLTLIDWLQEFILEVSVGQDECVMGHRQVAATLCPSFDVPDKLRELREESKTPVAETRGHLQVQANQLMREWRRLSNEANDIDVEMRSVHSELADILKRMEWLGDD